MKEQLPQLRVAPVMDLFPILREMLLPADDWVVALQFAAVLAAGTLGIIATRRQPEARVLVTGVMLFVMAGMGLRALH